MHPSFYRVEGILSNAIEGELQKRKTKTKAYLDFFIIYLLNKRSIAS